MKEIIKIVEIYKHRINNKLLIASKTGNLKDVVKLLSDGANPNAENQYSVTALMFASMGGNSKITKLLIQEGAFTDVKDIDGNTALTFALKGNNKKIINELTYNKRQPMKDKINNNYTFYK